MNKHIKRTLFIAAAYVIICIVNTALYTVEFAESMVRGMIIPFFANIHSDAPIWAMVGLNFIISVAAYIFAGRKKKSTQVVGA